MQTRAQQTRTRLQQAARAEFSARGPHGARVDRIARRARANKERLYAYFGGKEALFGAVLRTGLEEIAAEEAQLLAQLGDDPAHLTTALLTHYFSFQESHPHFWRLLAWENLSGGRHAPRLRGIKDDTLARLRALYREGQRRGVFSSAVSFEAYLLTVSAVSFFYFSNQATMRQTLGLDLAAPAVRRRMVKEIGQLISGNHE